MTTIAYDGKTLAADTRYTLKSSYHGFAHKILPLHSGGVVASAGSLGGGLLIKEAIDKGGPLLKNMTKKELDLVDSIYINKDGLAYWLCGSTYRWIPIDETTCATGTGEHVCMGFLRAGFSAADAVKATARVDINSNDLIDVYDIKRKTFKLVNFPK